MSRRLRAAFALTTLVASALVALGPAAPAQAAAADCPSGDTWHNVGDGGAGITSQAGVRLAEFEVAYNADDSRMCVVMEAVKWRGTSHYMSLKLCKTDAGGAVVRCNAGDSGNFQLFAGPVTSPVFNWGLAKVVIKSPTGNVAFDGYAWTRVD